MSKELRILYISHLHPPADAPLENMGGMQRVSMQLTDVLKSKPGIDIKTVIQHVSWKGVEWRTALFLIGLYFRLPKIVEKYKPDVILFSSMVTASLAAMLRKKISVPMVTINHGQDVTMPVGLYQKFIPRVFTALNGVISVSEATRQECIKRGMDPDKGVALPNGFDMSDLEESPEKGPARKNIEEQFEIDLTGKTLLLTVGRQVKRKGHSWFIAEVLPRIKSNVIYLVIGDGPEHENLKRQLQGSKFADKVILAGRQPDEVLKNAYSAADIFIMPNIPVPGDMEGFGIVLLEANLANTPSVAADLEGIKDVIVNGKNGYKIKVRDAEAFASRVDEYAESDLKEEGRRCKEFVKENFSWNSVAERYISYLRKIINNK
ncbi:glycosyltransferase family 4 protein [Balneola sp. MJW-20]|uniref:glycosyltransferase family 4 protein n=1 Tax=Gracilimonas aurantiaca TaxID=3234185 RepID=UPI0034674916